MKKKSCAFVHLKQFLKSSCCSYLLSDIPSVPLSLKQNKQMSQKTKKQKTTATINNINKQSKHNELHNYDIFLTNLQVTTINLFISNKDQCHSPFLFFSLWRQEWLMTTQEVWFNHRKSSFPIIRACKSCGIWIVTHLIVTRVMPVNILLIIITKRRDAEYIPEKTIFS